MDRHQRLQRQTVDAPVERLHSRSLQASSLQTRSFGVQKRSTASAPASKSELWDNYQSTKQLNQNATKLPIQTKVKIGQPGDKYEQEADSVADRVMSMSEPTQVQREAMPEEEELQMKPLAETLSPLVQREAMPEEEELQMKPEDNPIQREAMPEEEEMQMKSVDNSIQRDAMPEEEEELQMKPEDNPIQREAMPEEEEMQMKSVDNSIQREAMPEEEEMQMKQSPATNTPVPTSSLENRLSSSKGGGNPLSDDVRSFMEPRFGADFSGVRVHTGSDAVQMNRDVNAQAFAHGQDIYFGAGKAPGNDALTAHELTHVVQQTGEVSKKENNTPTTDKKAKPSHYKIELKAWIPQHQVVDPEEIMNQVLDLEGSIIVDSYTSRYRGDSHTFYDGSHRALSIAEFDYGGNLITNFSSEGGSFGETHRDWKSSVPKNSGTESGTATSARSSRVDSGKSFFLAIDTINPLVTAPAPAINSELKGVFDLSGQLNLAYNTDLFPSHGLRVYKDGVVIHTNIVNDASSVSTLGIAGAYHLAKGLSSHSVSGISTIPVASATP